MKYTVVIDTTLNTNLTESGVKQQLAHHFKVEHIESGDQTNNSFFSVMRWHKEDVAESLEQNGIPVTPDNIDLVIHNAGSLEDRCIERGWEVLEDIISNLEYDNAFDMGEDEDDAELV